MKISKSLQISLICIVSCFLLLMFLPGLIVPMVVSSQVKKRTDFSMDFGNVNISLLQGVIHFKNVQLNNSKEFPIKDFLNINEVKIDFNPLSLFQERFMIHNAVLNVHNVSFVQDKESMSNIDVFLKRLRKSFDKKENTEARKSKNDDPTTNKPFLIENLEIKLNSLTALVDNGTKEPIRADSTWVIDQSYKNVTQDTINQVTLPLTKDLTARGLSLMSQILIKKTLDAVPNANTIGEGLKNIGEKTTQQIQGAAKALKNLFE